jgi:hypothetical protein
MTPRRTTAGKAHAAGVAGALAPIALWLIAYWSGETQGPPGQAVVEAAGVLAVSAVAGAAAWIGAYLKRNYPKG